MGSNFVSAAEPSSISSCEETGLPMLLRDASFSGDGPLEPFEFDADVLEPLEATSWVPLSRQDLALRVALATTLSFLCGGELVRAQASRLSLFPLPLLARPPWASPRSPSDYLNVISCLAALPRRLAIRPHHLNIISWGPSQLNMYILKNILLRAPAPCSPRLAVPSLDDFKIISHRRWAVYPPSRCHSPSVSFLVYYIALLYT